MIHWHTTGVKNASPVALAVEHEGARGGRGKGREGAGGKDPAKISLDVRSAKKIQRISCFSGEEVKLVFVNAGGWCRARWSVLTVHLCMCPGSATANDAVKARAFVGVLFE
jgi:hypothetical protein